MDRHTFIYNFKNFPFTTGRKKTYLCYEVQLMNGNFRNPQNWIKGFLYNQYHPNPQLRRHAELWFLEWISSWQLYPGQHLRVTWFLSWSPCPYCAQKVASFLQRNSHVSLNIFAARIYDRLEGYEEGLRSLYDAGADIDIMTYGEFKYCWRAFVDNRLWPFKPWNRLDENSELMSGKLECILQSDSHSPRASQAGRLNKETESEREALDRPTWGAAGIRRFPSSRRADIGYTPWTASLKEAQPQTEDTFSHSTRYMDLRTFFYNFKNFPFTTGRNKTYLCYEVQLMNGDLRVPQNWIKGFLYNQYHPNPQLRRHAELWFLEWISSWQLYPGQHLRVTWFLSWSPCPYCAQEVASFLQRNSHVSLNIFAARIYDRLEGYEEGLRSLYDAGADIDIMTYGEFEYCWRAFVDNQLLPFKPWYRLDEYSEFTSEQLQRILQQRVSYFPPVP
nr:DNA dC->dU-editing enzyme APOBEC-3G-like [Loxodonta africana]